MESSPITADYLFQMAERIEQNGRQFYLLAAEVVPRDAVREMLLQLAGMEADHEKTFSAMRGRLSRQPEAAPPIDPAAETVGYIRALLAGKFFDPQVSPAAYLKGNESYQEVLLTAIGIQKETIVFYEGVRQAVAGSPDAEALEAIIREEMEHITKLAGAVGRFVR